MPLFGRVRQGGTLQPPTIKIQNQQGRYIPGSSLWARFRPITAVISKYVHKLLGNRTPVTRLADRTVRVVSDLSGPQKARLQSWAEAAESDADKANRLKAKEAILECAQKARTELSLEGLKLDSLPDVLGELRQIRALHIGGNQLKALPETLSGLRNLRYLGCKDNKLQSLPDWLANCTKMEYLNLMSNHFASFPESVVNFSKLKLLKLMNNNIETLPKDLSRLGTDHECRVFLSENKLSQEDIDEWNNVHNGGKLFVYCTPRVLFHEVGSATYKGLISHWYNMAGVPLYVSVFKKFQALDDTARDTLRIHLSKLTGTLDYIHPVRGLSMAARVAGILEAMAGDEDIMNDCLAASYEATSSCTDRALLGLNMMEQAAQLAKVRRLDDPAKLIEMGSGFWRIELVREVAQEQFKKQQGIKQLVTHHKGDQIEIELAYLLGLKEKLDLPLAEDQHMLNRSYSEVTGRMLENAEKKIKQDIEQNPDKEYDYLLSWPPLQEKLMDLYYGYTDEISDSYQEKMYELDVNDDSYNENLALLLSEKEATVNSFFIRAIESIREGKPLPYRRKDDVLKQQYEELARMKSEAGGRNDVG